MYFFFSSASNKAGVEQEISSSWDVFTLFDSSHISCAVQSFLFFTSKQKCTGIIMLPIPDKQGYDLPDPKPPLWFSVASTVKLDHLGALSISSQGHLWQLEAVVNSSL